MRKELPNDLPSLLSELNEHPTNTRAIRLGARLRERVELADSFEGIESGEHDEALRDFHTFAKVCEDEYLEYAASTLRHWEESF